MSALKEPVSMELVHVVDIKEMLEKIVPLG
jgi:hypothetical protein